MKALPFSPKLPSLSVHWPLASLTLAPSLTLDSRCSLIGGLSCTSFCLRLKWQSRLSFSCLPPTRGISWLFLFPHFLFLCYGYGIHLPSLRVLISVLLQGGTAALSVSVYSQFSTLSELASSPVLFVCCIRLSQRVDLSSPHLAVLGNSS